MMKLGRTVISKMVKTDKRFHGCSPVGNTLTKVGIVCLSPKCESWRCQLQYKGYATNINENGKKTTTTKKTAKSDIETKDQTEPTETIEKQTTDVVDKIEETRKRGKKTTKKGKNGTIPMEMTENEEEYNKNNSKEVAKTKSFTVKFRNLNGINGIHDNELLQNEIPQLLTSHGIKYIDGHTCFVFNCLKNNKRQKPIIDEAIYVNKATGLFTCLTCKKQGHLPALKENFAEISTARVKHSFECFKADPQLHSNNVQNLLPDDQPIKDVMSKAAALKTVSSSLDIETKKLFGMEKIKKTTLGDYKICYDPESKSLLLPYYTPDKELTGCKQLTPVYDEDGDFVEIKDTFTFTNERLSLFGWRDGDKIKKTLILTLREKDVMALHQLTNEHCVLSFVKLTQFPFEALPYLERFTTVYLWLGTDMELWNMSKQFAKKIGEKRCFVFRPGDDCPLPYDLIKERKNVNIDLLLKKATPVQNSSIISFPVLRKDVYTEVSLIEQVSGVKWKRYTQFNKILKGFRQGELTVMTGRTGSGKTTFMSEYSLDLCMQGVRTLWGSFEINNIKLAKTMLTQFAQMNLTSHLDQFDKYADQFEQLPMYFMTFFGQEKLNKVIETMSHAVYMYDIQHIIVDNLQFMMGDEMTREDKYSKQDKVISAFRRFASENNCHVSLVIHPRKEQEDSDLTTSSIFGSGKSTQEADNVMLLQDKRFQAYKGKKYIQITKNRFDGQVGTVNLKFNPDSLTYSSPEITVLKKTVKKSVQKRNENIQENEWGEKKSENDEYRKDINDGKNEDKGDGTEGEKIEDEDFDTKDDDVYEAATVR